MTVTLQSSLAAGARSGLYRLAGRTSAKAVRAVTEAAGWQFLHLDAIDVDEKAEFLAGAAETLRFPKWAGHNWDAFEELVNDLSWLPPRRATWCCSTGWAASARRQPGELAVALDVLQSAMANRQRAGETPMIILVRGAGPAAEDLPTMETGWSPQAHPATVE